MNKTQHPQFEENTRVANAILNELAPVLKGMGNTKNVLDMMSIVMANVIWGCVVSGNEMATANAVLDRIGQYFTLIHNEKAAEAAKLEQGIVGFGQFADDSLRIVEDDPPPPFPENTFEKMVEQAEDRANWDRDAAADAVDAGKDTDAEEVEDGPGIGQWLEDSIATRDPYEAADRAMDEAKDREAVPDEPSPEEIQAEAKWDEEDRRDAANDARIDGDTSEASTPEQDPQGS